MAIPTTGQVVVTGTAQSLSPNNLNETAFTVKAAVTNAHPVYVGSGSVTPSTGFRMDPGDSISVEKSSQLGRPMYQVGVGDFSVVGTTPDVVSWLTFP